jgi:hypothetical protein
MEVSAALGGAVGLWVVLGDGGGSGCGWFWRMGVVLVVGGSGGWGWFWLCVVLGDVELAGVAASTVRPYHLLLYCVLEKLTLARLQVRMIDTLFWSNQCAHQQEANMKDRAARSR